MEQFGGMVAPSPFITTSRAFTGPAWAALETSKASFTTMLSIQSEKLRDLSEVEVGPSPTSGEWTLPSGLAPHSTSLWGSSQEDTPQRPPMTGS